MIVNCHFLILQRNWEDRVDCKTLKVILEILVDVEKKDPVTGAWHIPETKRGVVWCGVV